MREMDESEKMDPSIIQGLFENGVSGWCDSLPALSSAGVPHLSTADFEYALVHGN